MWGQSVYLTALFLGRFRPPKQLTSTLCKYDQGPKVIPRQYFPIDFNAFTCLQEN